MHPNVHAAQLTVAKTWKQPKCPSTAEWIKKMQYIYTKEYYPATKKGEIMPFAVTWKNLGIIILTEVSQKKTTIVSYHLYVEPKKMMQMNSFTKQKQTHSLQKQTYGCQRGKGRGGMNQDFGNVKCTHLYMEWMVNGDLLCSTGKSIQ